MGPVVFARQRGGSIVDGYLTGRLEGMALNFRYFQDYCKPMATPFDWRFTRDDLTQLTRKFVHSPALRLAA